MKLGIITPAYITQERHDISLAWAYSMVQAAEHIPAGMLVKQVIIDDCSPAGEDVFKAYHSGVKFIKRFYFDVRTNTIRRGKWSLSKNFVDGVKQFCHEGETWDYIISIPDDVLVNKYIFEAIYRSVYLFDDEVRAITFFKDNRRDIWGKGISEGIVYNPHFKYAPSCDGFMLLSRTDDYRAMIKPVDEREAQAQGSTLVWRNVNKYLKKYAILEYNESLAQHIGNSYSAMVGAPRNKERYIYAHDVNLFNMPKILNKER